MNTVIFIMSHTLISYGLTSIPDAKLSDLQYMDDGNASSVSIEEGNFDRAGGASIPCTDGCETRSDVLFLVTEGLPTGEEVCSAMKDRMSQSDVDVALIIVDVDAVLDDTSAIDCLDTNNGQEDVTKLKGFTSASFDAIEARIGYGTLGGNNSAGLGKRPTVGSEWVYEDGSMGLDPVPEHEQIGGIGGNAVAAEVTIDDEEDMFKLRHYAGDNRKKYNFKELHGIFVNICLMD